jgi:hypothetical protein
MQTIKQLEEQARLVQEQQSKIDQWKQSLSKQVDNHEEKI